MKDIRKIIRQELSKLMKKSKDQKSLESDIQEIDLPVNMSRRAKPGPGRNFPVEKEEGGTSLNISVSDGPHEFPK